MQALVISWCMSMIKVWTVGARRETRPITAAPSDGRPGHLLELGLTVGCDTN